MHDQQGQLPETDGVSPSPQVCEVCFPHQDWVTVDLRQGPFYFYTKEKKYRQVGGGARL